jgi:hypothetical protein
MSIHKEALDRAKIIAQIEALNAENKALNTVVIMATKTKDKSLQSYQENNYTVIVCPTKGKRKAGARSVRGSRHQELQRRYGLPLYVSREV